MRVWYRVRDLDAGRDFYTRKLGFTETYFDEEGRWAKLEQGEMKIALAEGEPEDAGVATIDVEDAKAEAERLRELEVEVGTVLELYNEVRLLDVFDPDGNRIQLVEQLRHD
ncbi:MAG TPA: VOC family protein [Gaiellaceae bacterium]|jgi:catechol 2,3-dioxygenase-like lactoylglutathione lyase family enzyme|nr:VOC family protein [Gaiellaceae bacterium]